MKYILLLITIFATHSCSSKIYLNPKYSNETIKGASLAIVDVDSYSKLMDASIIDSLLNGEGNKLVTPPLRASIERQSHFAKVSYSKINDISNFTIQKVHTDDEVFNIFAPKKGTNIKIDSLHYDFVLITYCPLDSVNDDSSLISFFYRHYKDKSVIVYSDNFSLLSLFKNVEFSGDKYILNDFVFFIWDNKKNHIVNYGKYDQFWARSYRELILGAGRIVMIKSPFYKGIPPR